MGSLRALQGLMSHAQVSLALQPLGLLPARFHCPWNSPGKNTRDSCYFLLQGISLTDGLNPSLLQLLPQQADSSVSAI